MNILAWIILALAGIVVATAVVVITFVIASTLVQLAVLLYREVFGAARQPHGTLGFT